MNQFFVFTAGNQYLTGLTLYFIGYVIFEVGQPTHLLATDVY